MHTHKLLELTKLYRLKDIDTIEEKENVYTKAPSGGPLVQHAVVALFEAYHQNKISVERIVEKMAHNPAKIFKIEKRGFIKEGYYADLVLVNTCSIREKAELTVRKRLEKYNAVKRINPKMKVGVLGCMAERLKEKFLDEEKKALLIKTKKNEHRQI